MLPDRTALQVRAIVQREDEVCQKKLAAVLAELDAHEDVRDALVWFDLERGHVGACGEDEWEATRILIAALDQALARSAVGGTTS